ncbi:MAG: hypothetical protein R3A78_10605 [Polyangiales bacterium]|nr:hypothetical protein [Myxococcales bacterium]
MEQSRFQLVLWCALFAFLCLELLLVGVRRAWRSYQGRVHAKAGLAAERRAESLLRKRGYRIEAVHAESPWRVRVNGELREFRLRADFLAWKDGARFVVEVKSGERGRTVASAETRRQLLEYALAFDVDGVLLLDARERSLERIEFVALHAPLARAG